MSNHLIYGHDVLTWILEVIEDAVEQFPGLIQRDLFCATDRVLKDWIFQKIVNGFDHTEKLFLET